MLPRDNSAEETEATEPQRDENAWIETVRVGSVDTGIEPGYLAIDSEPIRDSYAAQAHFTFKCE